MININDLQVQKYIVIKLPYYKDLAIIPDMCVALGSWAQDWVYQTARIEFHNWCDNFNYKIHLVPVGEYETVGVSRSWYTHDMVGFDNNIQIFNTIEDAEKYRNTLIKKYI